MENNKYGALNIGDVVITIKYGTGTIADRWMKDDVWKYKVQLTDNRGAVYELTNDDIHEMLIG